MASLPNACKYIVLVKFTVEKNKSNREIIQIFIHLKKAFLDMKYISNIFKRKDKNGDMRCFVHLLSKLNQLDRGIPVLMLKQNKRQC